ncbi:polyvinylalcohol dehydrogenase-like [Vitis riparia]|uniref:polyvinylalcohol dehydrogenase-like n=1 Tax=Vitis riparia TaxID=96939 RepID=UPI00155A1A3C|nr:polyvinylalcohol dehydrogenase-like [Vitis riparia]
MAPHEFYNNPSVLFLCMFSLLAITASADSSWNSLSHEYSHQEPADWLNHGGDLYNRRYASSETKISPETVSKLSLKWEFYAGQDITATPAIFNGTLYFPSWNGYLYAVKATDGSLVWKQNLQTLTGLNGTGLIVNVNWTVSRSTPTMADDMLIVGIYGPAVVIAVEQATGRLVWSTRLDSNPTGIVTMSGTFHKGGFYVGTSSVEEELSIEQCCVFRGSLSKLDIKTGVILWQTFTLPDNHGKRGEYAGAAIWGSSPSMDVRRNLEQQNNQTAPTQTDQCIEPDNHSNSILAFDLDSGKIKWYRQLGGYDLWFFACNNLSTPNCPPGPNPDADFGEAPIMLSINLNGTKRDVVSAVQKSGFAWALDRYNGSLVWSTEAGPGGLTGGGTWGAATDNKRVYTNIANSDSKNFTLKPSEKNTTAGGWVAMDASTGKILWSTADPSNATSNGPVTIANGVLFGGSTHPTGPIYAMDARSGKILWSHNTGATVYGGISASNGCIYLGNGYKVNLGSFTASFTNGTSLFAFCV